jgi:integrase
VPRQAKRPNRPEFRYLHRHARRGIVYERRFRGRRYYAATGTSDWHAASAFRADFEREHGIGLDLPGPAPAELPSFDQLVDDYLAYLRKGLGDLAENSRENLKGTLRKSGPLRKTLGPLRVDRIDKAALWSWLDGFRADFEATHGRRPSRDTERLALAALASVLSFAEERGLIEEIPPALAAVRRAWAKQGRTKAGRAYAEARDTRRPVESPADLDRLLDAANAEGTEAHALVLILLDAGLRLGEALGLLWSSIEWDARQLVIDGACSRGKNRDRTKTGRSRVVQLSRRLEVALRQLRGDRIVSPDALVFEGIDASNFRAREWRRILKRADVRHADGSAIRLKDLRDSFGSHLVSAGIPLAYVSAQLGHADVAVTAKHYAKWTSASYVQPPALAADEVPADLLARLGTPALQSTGTE